jgi:hypothetical protein
LDTGIALSSRPVDARWDIAQRVARSASFQRSPRLRELLLYICERAIQNRPQDLREQQIGCGVFGRKPEYNPGEDNIVRVEIRQLRKRLDEYFATEGKDEPLVIAVPKGAYVPAFEPRAATPAELPALAAPVEAPAAAEEPAPVSTTAIARRAWLLWIPAAVAAILAVTCVSLWLLYRKSERELAAAVRPAVERTALWPLIFDQDHQTLVVCADSTLVVAQTILHRSISLEDYLTHDYAGTPDHAVGEEGSLLRLLSRWQFTDLADLRLVQRLYRINGDYWDKVQVRSAKTAAFQDFKNGNIVLLGSNRSNPWNRLFEPMLNFQFDFDDKTRTPLIRNRTPLPGEEAEYRGAPAGQSGNAYSLIALVPNLRHTGNVLIVAGTTAESTEATGEFVTNGRASAGFLSTLMRRNKGRLPYFEVLLKSGMLAGVAGNVEIVATRIVAENSAK